MDNVTPALLGDFTLVRIRWMCKIEVHQLYATVVYPQIELKTSDAFRIETNCFLEKCHHNGEMWADWYPDYTPKIMT
jgi:homoserine kinase